jgi:hypothetical protein
MYSYQSTETVEAGLARLSELKARLDSRGPLPRIWLGRTRRELEAEAVSRLHFYGGRGCHRGRGAAHTRR